MAARGERVMTAGSKSLAFRAPLFLNGKTATGIEVPEHIVTGLGSTRRPAVKVTLGSYTYRTTIAPMGGSYWIPVSAEVRAGAGIAAGDELDVRVELDTDPREVTVPADLTAALAGDDGAREFFESLSYSNKRRIVLSIEDAKTAETRQRRIDKALANLRDGKV